MRRTTQIPAKEHFFSALTNSHINDEDYAHCLQVYSSFSCADLVEYGELYCKSDVSLLAEVVTKFRKLVLENFKLDCCHYISTPQLAFDCMLFKSGVHIELLHCIE
jgi:hypothetical protein